MTVKTVVIGGGIAGICSAFFLHLSGHDIVLINADDIPGSQASNSNAMQLCYGTIAPYAGMADIKKYSRYLIHSTPDSPVYIRPDFSVRFLKFLLFSGWTALPRPAQARREELYKMAVESRAVMGRFQTSFSDIDFHFKPTGKMRLYETRRSFESEADMMAHMNEKYDIGVELLDRAETYAREPALMEKSQDIFVSTYSPIDASGDSGLLARQLHETMQATGRYDYRGGCRVLNFKTEKGRVTRIETDQGTIHAGNVVIAAGAASGELLKLLGIGLPMIPVKGYSLTLANPPFLFSSCISDISRKFAWNTYGGENPSIRLSGLMDFVGHNTDLDPRRVQYLKSQIKSTFPALNLDAAETRCGLRPITGNSLPVIGRRGFKNLWVNTGQGVYGWTLAMGSAERLIREMTDA